MATTTINYNTTDPKPKLHTTNDCHVSSYYRTSHRLSGPNESAMAAKCNGDVVHDQLSLSFSSSVVSGIQQASSASRTVTIFSI
ncbi:hypothetical protein T4D_13874 [Trichinella pseudospiralis]|uniref:Uncharacterized protein n=1 Tax=Trichinella pseudospiralis TaxID=6337 RepID=A0A0V1G2H2_TRIPS|nr:hypothetical protein T4D_13874 [Trichinella pseudospiralis]